MQDFPPQKRAPGVLSREGLPIVGTFLIWGTGSGAQTLARPLFAYALTDSVFPVTLLISVLALSRMVSGPLTGYLADHWGRKPMAVTGAAIRGTASGLVFFTDSFPAFFALEFIGAIGVAMWQTTSQVIVADMSTPENRGRAVATRNTTLRFGQIVGPLMGGVVAGMFGLQAVFLINSVSKFVVMIVTWRMVKETRPGSETAKAEQPKRGSHEPEPGVSMWSIIASRPFVALAVTTIAIAFMNQGVFMTLFPIAAKEEAGLDTAQIGTLVAIASAITLIISFPNGVIVDKYGRKASLVPGLILAGGAGILLALLVDFRTAFQAAAVFGIAQSMTQGANQTYAMDLAPEDRRGAFLGMWTSIQSFGAFVGPLAVGAAVEFWSFSTAFYGVAVLMTTAGLAMAILGPETKARSDKG
ncbi:MAG: MFS transporter [Chloroflexi bacterium]|nr:MFS transporter [Chloroflexota bacterium]